VPNAGMGGHWHAHGGTCYLVRLETRKLPRRMKRHNSMFVTFVRTGERRYAVRAAVLGKAVVEMSPAPGYDPMVPHDLQHFIVERTLGIEGGVFGQLAAGGTAGTFSAVEIRGKSRRTRERRKRAAKQAKLALSRDGPLRSERATYICWHNWLSQSSDPALRAKARAMEKTLCSIVNGMRADERALYSTSKLTQVRAEFERLSARWSKLKVGESFTEPW
jgi:hypothetical protein